MMRRIRSLGPSTSEAGVGVITVVMVVALLTAFLLTAVTTTVNNLGNASRDRQALTALATSEAGVSQALQYIRGGSLGALTCLEASQAATCQGAGPSWTSAANPMQVRFDGTAGACVLQSDCFKVWIGTVQQYVPNCPGRRASPPTPCSGVYRIHSTGISGGGPGARKLAVDVSVTPYPFPIGVFADTLSGNGNVGVHRQSIFTNGCMMNRQRDDRSGSGIQFEWDAANNRPVLDLIYDQPSAAHATGDISTSNTSCGSGGGGAPIHNTTTSCDPAFPYDQSGAGADLPTSSSCYGRYTRSDGSKYPTSSKFTAAQLQNYGYRPRGLTDSQYDALKSQAQAQGTYNLAPSSISARLTALAATGTTSPILYWDNGNVSLNSSHFPASFLRNLNTSSTCAMNSVTIVVSGPGSDLAYTGGNTAPYLVASIFVPDGQLTGSGGRNTIGTVFAKTLDLGGNVEFYMDQCFANNPPGATLDAKIIDWREDDGANNN